MGYDQLSKREDDGARRVYHMSSREQDETRFDLSIEMFFGLQAQILRSTGHDSRQCSYLAILPIADG